MSDAYNRSRNSISEKQWPKRLEKNYNGARRVNYFASANNQTQSQPFYCISNVIKQTQQFYLLTHFRRSWDLWAFSQQTRKCTSRDRGKVKHQHRNVSGLAKKNKQKKKQMARLKYAWERGSAHWNTQSKHSIFLINELSKWVFLRKSVNSRYGLAYEVVADGILKSAIKRNHSFTLSHIFRAGPWSRGRLVIVSSRQTSTARRFS